MTFALNLLYLFAWVVASPWLAYRSLTTGRYRQGMWAKWSGAIGHAKLQDARSTGAPVVWFHGVSVGEIHLLRTLVRAFRHRFPHVQCVISSTTATGHAEAEKHFPDLPIVWWPFDFSWAVLRGLETVGPHLVVLAESEVWPNFLRLAKRKNIRIALVNGRMSPRSASRMESFRWVMAPLFRCFDVIGAQSADYAVHYSRLTSLHGSQPNAASSGPSTKVVLTGNIKYDGVQSDRANPRTQALRTLFSIAENELVLVFGSTQDPEEALAIEIYRRFLSIHPNLRLVLVPRHPERFDEVAHLLTKSGLPFVRRSQLTEGKTVRSKEIVLGDTMGELSAIWGLADIAFVGGSLDGKRGGQNMIEPAGYGATVVFGPHTWNFKETVTHLLRNSAAFQIQDGEELEACLGRLLKDTLTRRQVGEAARNFVISQQGATERTLDALAPLLPEMRSRRDAA